MDDVKIGRIYCVVIKKSMILCQLDIFNGEVPLPTDRLSL